MSTLVIDRMIAPAFLLMGLSHVMQPRLWTRFFERLKQTGLAAVIIPLYTLPFGLLLIATHTAWPLDWSLVYTIAGWMMTLKSTIYLLVPGAADRVLAHRIAKTPTNYQIVGTLMAVLGAVLTWIAWVQPQSP